MIKNLFIFDCDGTLLNTPSPEEGKLAWSNFYNIKYPHKGWWGRSESLDPKVFKIEPISTIIDSYNYAKNIPKSKTIMLTSREPKLKDLLIEHLHSNNLFFDDYLFKSGNKDKPQRIDQILDNIKTIDYVEVWDDRDKEILLYQSWKPIREITLKINKINL